MAFQGYNIDPLPAPVLVKPAVIQKPNLLDPSAFAHPIIVPRLDFSDLGKTGEALGKAISEVFPSEKTQMERQAYKDSLDAADAQSNASAALADRTLDETMDPALATQRKVDEAKALGSAQFEMQDAFAQKQAARTEEAAKNKLVLDAQLKNVAAQNANVENFHNAVLQRYGVAGLKSVMDAETAGADLRTPDGKSKALEGLQQLDAANTAGTGTAGGTDVNSMLNNPINSPQQGAEAIKRLKGMGYDATLTEVPATGKFGFRQWKLGIKGYNAPPNSNPVSNIPTTQDGTPDLASDRLNLPLELSDPTRNLATPKDKDAMQTKLQVQGQAYLQKLQPITDEARQKLQDVNEFKDLNSKVGTGGVYGIVPGINKLRTAFDPDANRMQSIQQHLIPRERVPGMRVTNYDLPIFANATVGLDKPKAANDRIADAVEAHNQRQIDYSDFLNSYMSAPDNRGGLAGADAAWSKYENANPIFDPYDPNAKTNYTLNNNRMPWQDYFKAQNIDNLKRRGTITADQATEALSNLRSANPAPQNAAQATAAPGPSAQPASAPTPAQAQSPDLWQKVRQGNTPASSTPITATGPKGEKIQLVNGKWVPLQ